MEEDPDEYHMTQQQNEYLMDACMTGDLEKARASIEKGAQVKNKEAGWTPLSCAAANNYTDIVRHLCEKSDAALAYLRKSDQPAPEVSLGIIKENIETTPLLWACEKGCFRVMCILLKEKLMWNDIDSVGNTAIHLAAASNLFECCEVLLEFGVDITLKNSRGHTPLSLTTNQAIQALIKSYLKTEECPKTNRKFNLNEIKYLCHNCRIFMSKEARHFSWTYFDLQDTNYELPLSLCLDCHRKTEETLNELSSIISTNDESRLEKYIAESLKSAEDPVTMDVKSLNRASTELEKLRAQNRIKEFLQRIAEIDDYKIIKKHDTALEAMVKDAKNRGVRLDDSMLDIINRERLRLEAERALRKFMDHMDMTKCDINLDRDLGNHIKEAERVGVSAVYRDQAQVRKTKLSKTLDAMAILDDFQQFEQRPPDFKYPLYPQWHRQKKKWLLYTDPKKPTQVDMEKPYIKKPNLTKKDLKKLELTKKPAWFTSRQEIVDRHKKLTDYLADPDLTFDQDFMLKAKEELQRMNNEEKFIGRLEEDDKIILKMKEKNKKKR